VRPGKRLAGSAKQRKTNFGNGAPMPAPRALSDINRPMFKMRGSHPPPQSCILFSFETDLAGG
jgi:hypothetical protein